MDASRTYSEIWLVFEDPMLSPRHVEVLIAEHSYTAGKEPPASCAKLPQTDADIPLAPYDKYPKANFTELIAKLKAEDKVKNLSHTMPQLFW